MKYFFCFFASCLALGLYPNNLKSWEFDKEAPRNFSLERENIVSRHGSSEEKNCEGKQASSGTNSSSCFGIEASSRMEVGGSFLFGNTHVNGLSSSLQRASGSQQKVQALGSVWGVGFDIKMGYRSSHDEWKYSLEGLSFRSHCTEWIKGGAEGLLPVWISSSDVTKQPFREIKEHYRLHLAAIDLKLSREIQVARHLKLSPSLALIWTSARQKYFLDELPVTSSTVQEVLIRMKTKFWGIGPQLGSAFEWLWAKRFSLVGDVSAALLYGSFYVHEGQRLEPGTIKLLRLFNCFTSTSALYKMGLGIRWYPIKERLSVEMGWDQFVLSAQNQFLRSLNSSSPGIFVGNQGDLSFVGGHVQFLFSF